MKRAALLLFLVGACGDDSGDETSTSDATTGTDSTTSATSGELPEANCVVDLDCGIYGSACTYPYGCDGPGRCDLDKEPLGECPFNPAPLLPRPDGLTCTPTVECSQPGYACFYWDGKCGREFVGICVPPDKICELTPPEIDAKDSWCKPPTVPPGGGFESCESPKY